MHYTTTASGDTQFEQFGIAREIADGFTREHHIEVKVLGHIDGADEPVLSYQTSPNVVDGIKQGDFSPWERVEPVPNTFVPISIPGATLAYKRVRIAVGVYRKDDKTGWIVWESATGEQHHLPTTKAACNLTTSLHTAYQAAKHGASEN